MFHYAAPRLFTVQQAIEKLTEVNNEDVRIESYRLLPIIPPTTPITLKVKTKRNRYLETIHLTTLCWWTWATYQLGQKSNNYLLLRKQIDDGLKPTKVLLSPRTTAQSSMDEKVPLLCGKTCYHTFRLYCDIEMIDLIIEETEQYARENKNILHFFINRKEMLAFIGVLLYSDYVTFPNEA